jgi:signal transduction histidine kinase
MQRLLGVLRSEIPLALQPQPDAAQLSDLAAIVRSAGLAVELAVTGDLSRLAPSAQLAVYRIVQESLTNVLKHAHNVAQVTVDIVHRTDRVSVRVTNDGDDVVADHQVTTGHGLAGMRERAGLYHGRFEAGPVAGGGWLVDAELTISDAVLLR